MRRLVLTTGGTGGHIFPALALAEELRRRDPQIGILFIGSERGPEKALAEKAGLKFQGLPARGFLGRGLRAVPAAFDLCASLVRAGRLIHAFKPDAIASFGGYASFAAAFAGKLLGAPLLLHEQNAVAGAANRVLGRWADKICVSLPGTTGFKKGAAVTGNPVRAAIRKAGFRRPGKKGRKLRLLVIGGSQGAHALTDFIARSLPVLTEFAEIRLQTGPADLSMARNAFAERGLPPESVQAFIEEMAEAYAWADAALCRAGASTCAELCAAGLPAVLVPFPAAIHDHQTLNARSLVNAGAAKLAPEPELDKVPGMLRELLADGMLAAMSEAAFALGGLDAASAIASELESMAKRPSNE